LRQVTQGRYEVADVPTTAVFDVAGWSIVDR